MTSASVRDDLVRTAFAHDAVVTMDPDGDDCAPGAAITLALCGSWSHEPPCPLAPHFTGVRHTGTDVALRVLFVATPADEARVRRLIEEALVRGWGEDPEGDRTSWRLVSSAASPVRADEQEHAGRLARS